VGHTVNALVGQFEVSVEKPVLSSALIIFAVGHFENPATAPE
jgi:hypothetical protein